MVQRQTRRRSSLVMGVLLALLLGIAAGFFVLALPIRMLETVTTFTGLSKLLVQAEPPISPNDRSVLAVLIGLLTAGVGWVFVDWLIFGRAGMSRLIRTREDDFEEEDEYSFRTTDPLDLVAPVPQASGDWSAPASSDARRPLSALTDIGDPPGPGMPNPVSAAAQPPAFTLPLPVDLVIPGVGSAAPPLEPGVPPPLFAVPVMPAPDRPPYPNADATPAFPPILGEPRPAAAPPAGGGWLPAPGLRPEASEDDAGTPPVFDPIPPEAAMVTPPAFGVEPPPPAPAWPPVLPVISPMNSAPVPPVEPAPPSPEPPLVPVTYFSAETSPPRPAPPVTPPAPAGANLIAGFDKAQLGELLDRLERGLQKRRAAAAAASSAPNPVAPEPAPVVRPAAPAGFAAPASMPLPNPIADIPHPPAMDQVPVPHPFAQPSVEPSAAAPQPLVDPPSGGHDALLDQPLHMTLEMLRNRVKR